MATKTKDARTTRRPAGALIKWAGSKRLLLPKLKDYWTVPSLRYVELFCGSAALYFAIRPNDALLNDINRDLISTYRQVRRTPLAIYRRMLSIPKTQQRYYSIRASIGSERSVETRAANFLFLNRFAFNGIYRVNQEGRFNVPFSNHKNGRFPTESEFLSLAKFLKKAKLASKDFAEIARHCGSGDFVYLDPPYVRHRKRTFEYSPDSFTIQDIARLDETLSGLHDRGALFVLSYAQCPEIMSIARKWNTKIVTTRRSVSADPSQRRRSRELIINNIA